MRRRWLVPWLLVCGIVASSHAQPAATPMDNHGRSAALLRRFEESRPQMGTQFRIVFYAPDERSASQAAEAAWRSIDSLNAIMSDYLDQSELNSLSLRSGGPAIGVSDDLFAVLSQSSRYYQASGGAFDITVGPAVRLWRRARRQRRLPDPQAIAQARTRIGGDKILLDPDLRTVRLTHPKMRLDLGGIGKGYAADAALAVLAQHAITAALIDAGGSLRLGDPPPGTTGWRVQVRGIEDAVWPGLKNCGLATSGDLEQFVELDGKRYSHIVDPRTAMALTNRRQATVVAATATAADAIATALCVLESPRGQEWIEAMPEVEAMVRDSMDAGESWRSSGWPAATALPAETVDPPRPAESRP